VQQYLWLLAPLAFVVLSCFIGFIVSPISGWGKMARHFRATEKPSGKVFYFQRARINGTTYSGCLNIITAPEGCYFSLWAILRPGHPPLLIPWNAFSDFQTQNFFWLSYQVTTITLKPFEKVTIAFCDEPIVKAIRSYRATHHI
jgi:hypothetical protein